MYLVCDAATRSRNSGGTFTERHANCEGLQWGNSKMSQEIAEKRTRDPGRCIHIVILSGSLQNVTGWCTRLPPTPLPRGGPVCSARPTSCGRTPLIPLLPRLLCCSLHYHSSGHPNLSFRPLRQHLLVAPPRLPHRNWSMLPQWTCTPFGWPDMWYKCCGLTLLVICYAGCWLGCCSWRPLKRLLLRRPSSHP